MLRFEFLRVSVSPCPVNIMKKILIACVMFFVSGCSSVPPLEYTHESAEALARAALRAFEQRDVSRLRQMALSEEEFRRHVWPELPAARPERNLPFSYVWGDLRQKSEGRLRERVVRYGGAPMQFVRLEFEAPATQYASYVVHRDSLLIVRGRDGQEQRVKLFGSVLEKDGAFKIFSFNVDE
jgi:uncharacterized protein YceK